MGLSNILENQTAESIVLQRIQQTFRLLAPLEIRETGQPQSYRQDDRIATRKLPITYPKQLNHQPLTGTTPSPRH